MKLWNFVHGITFVSIHVWEFLAVVLVVVMAVVALIHRHNQKKREKEHEKEMAEK